MLLAYFLINLYRQRFFLDWKEEYGLHWRAAVLRYAKWPQILIAFADILANRQHEYETTPKTRTKSTTIRVLWPHLVVALVMAFAWLFGVLNGAVVHWSFHFWPGFLVAISLFIISAGLRREPPPFEIAVLREAVKRRQIGGIDLKQV